MPRGGSHRARVGRASPKLKVLEGSFRKDRDGSRPDVVGGFRVHPEGLSEMSGGSGRRSRRRDGFGKRM